MTYLDKYLEGLLFAFINTSDRWGVTRRLPSAINTFVLRRMKYLSTGTRRLRKECDWGSP